MPQLARSLTLRERCSLHSAADFTWYSDEWGIPQRRAKVVSMGQTPLDAMIEECVALALSQPEGWRPAPRTLVRDWPRASVAEIILALTEAAHAIEVNFDDQGPSGPQPTHLYRMAALIALDLQVMEALGLSRKTAADLLAYWHHHDRFFLDV